ncbi:DUF3413 domain-containing protein [Marinomonas sp. M1K-6]|uniref:DUF3413 domain-containing protein n=1 Tax=Marinomonas profundi TaxID=2726122 RepID=A0A847QUZ8_9GAMM|nr:DUF3413 domain-containing protein [Marinomonas profundi]NLQ16498.1 DUF3413 domain-containing protein [Marinomonas profundi]UDV03912.1 DUF3413 domain-containing protein [Marinomonas profundi]
MVLGNKRSVFGLFLIINIFFSIILAIRYFSFLPEFPTDALGISFIVTSLIGQMALLGGILGFFAFFFIFLPRSVFYLVVSFLASIALFVLLIDTFVFAQYRFHINEVVLKLVLSGDVVDFSIVTWFIAIFSFFIIFLIEYALLHFLTIRSITNVKKRYFVSLFVVCFFASNFIHIWAAANAYQPVTISKSYLPLFQPATANGLMRKHGWIDEEALAQQRALSLKVSSSLNYPTEELETGAVNKPFNILFLVVDSWRFDTFNADNTPNMWSYSQNGLSFSRHMSTGNATSTGIFGLFYGLPGTYWQSALANQKSPVFMDRLQDLNYELGIFSSASLTDPEFNRTVFSKVNNLRLRSEGDSPSERDAKLTEDWLQWYQLRDKSKPAFSFLFYDAPHGYDFPESYDKKYEPMLKIVNYLALNNDTDPTLFMNRYKTSVRYVDHLAKKVLDELEASGDAENTIVVITGDHAQELNDNKLNYWGHNSNFTAAQIHVPFVVVGPGFSSDDASNVNQSLTSHEDVVPTLMKNYLGVKNPINHYSEGIDLLSDKNARDWVLSASYSGYAMITNDDILEVGAGGQYKIYDLTNRVKKDAEPNYVYLKEMLESVSRFKK